ncbi:MAG: hypothetical protein JJU29_12675 [Verrucomicrobia bacterium]|nr:hypothetical protein [Verrucomicrobiota bacterium]MCH8512649.1 hypothetical protein [Kiritimatiellia bacterium]
MDENNSQEIFNAFFEAFQNGTMTRELEGKVQAWMSDPTADADLVEIASGLWQVHLEAGRPVVDGKPKPPSVLGEPFHNPYTFVPFPQEPPHRRKPTPLSMDELPEERSRFTGVLDLELKLLSPLITSKAEPDRDDGGHKTYSALCVGEDVILPASGVRGTLRNLMSLLTGGTLGYVDEDAWLCQGRDARLGPKPIKPTPQSHLLPDHCFLAEVVKPGGINKSGTLRLGDTKLKDLRQIEGLLGRNHVNSLRPKPGHKVQYIWVDDNLTTFAEDESEENAWKLKLSGRPINPKGKREGIFRPSNKIIEVAAGQWAAYCGRNLHGDFGELKSGDLVWLETRDRSAREINEPNEIKSIQWARWGREGERLLDVISERHPHQIPDSLNPDGNVDEVTDLFGQVPSKADKTREILQWRDWEPSEELPGPAASFSARIRPGNLVFTEGTSALQRAVPLSPLSVPHPGCAAFYRQPHEGLEHTFHEDVSNRFLGLRGFKVYRNTMERNHEAPWKYENQGVYDDGRLKGQPQKTNKTVDLLRDDKAPTGKLRLSLRGLSQREVALILSACAVDWRLGGGKPLGLGHCRVSRLKLQELRDDGTLHLLAEMRRDDVGIAKVPLPYAEQMDEKLKTRMHLWQATQEPVPRLRYPRAVVQNGQKINRGGHVWFNRHASPIKSGKNDADPKGLEVLHVSKNARGLLKGQAPHILPQPLPLFESENPLADQLYGYDLYQDNEKDREQTKGTEKPSLELKPFDTRHHRSTGRGGGENLSQNRERREQTRENRRG